MAESVNPRMRRPAQAAWRSTRSIAPKVEEPRCPVSWWIGLSREDFSRRASERVPVMQARGLKPDGFLS